MVKIWNYLFALSYQSSFLFKNHQNPSKKCTKNCINFGIKPYGAESCQSYCMGFQKILKFRISDKSSLGVGLDRLAVELLVGKDDGLRSGGLLTLFCNVLRSIEMAKKMGPEVACAHFFRSSQ